LRTVTLVAQWERMLAGLPGDWDDVRVVLRVADEGTASRAAALLGPLMPGRSGREVRFYAARRGAGPSPASVRRALARLDAERIEGELELLGSAESVVEEAPRRPTLAESWDAALETLPPDWSDLYGPLELRSSDHLEPAALALAPLNPARYGGTPGFRF